MPLGGGGGGMNFIGTKSSPYIHYIQQENLTLLHTK